MPFPSSSPLVPADVGPEGTDAVEARPLGGGVEPRAADAPAASLFEAYTTPELVKRWWGFETSQWLVCDIDLRVGGQRRDVTPFRCRVAGGWSRHRLP